MKNKLRIGLVILITCLILPGFAQKPVFKWGRLYQKQSMLSGGNSLIGFNDVNYYTLGTIKHGWWIFGSYMPAITQNDNRHTPVTVREFSNKRGKVNLVLSGDIIYLDNTFHIFASKYNTSIDKNIIYKKTLNGDLSEESDWEEFDEMYAKNSNDARNFDFMRSEDDSKILLYRNNPVTKTSKKESVTYKMYDNKFKQLWEKKLEFDVDEKKYDILRYSVTNDGQVILLGRRDLTKKEKVKKMPSYKYLLYLYDNQKDQLEEFQISLGKMYITEISYTIDNKNNKLMLAGFYSNKGPGNLTGTFYQRIDISTKKVDIEQTKEFERDFMMDHMTEKKVDKNKELHSYDIRELIKRDDGGLTLVAEQYYVVVTTSSNTVNGRTTTTTTYHYHYNDIIVVNINSDGKIGWSLTIPKVQHSINDGGYMSSYAFHVKDDKMYFIFYDNPDNYNNNTNKRTNKRLKINVSPMPSLHKSVIGMAVVDYEGYVTRSVLQKSNKDLKVKRGLPLFVPKLSRYMNDKLLVQAHYGKKYQLGFLTFDNNAGTGGVESRKKNAEK
ncbi:MAG: hypothetical protein Q8M15_11625 [Bacteroidota bacterium]|nr:hypothetical protein [Bacteroidota bacterium]